MPQITSALREMLDELQIEKGKVSYAVASQSVFARFVKLPSVDEEKIQRIISFEAQQNVPFPINEVVWDYQLVGGGTEEQIQVALVAIKADLLEGINTAIENTGLEALLVDVATMALYNAFRYNYEELSGCSLLVDIGARTTNLLFIEPGKIFSRSIPIGGNAISSAIAKEMSEPLAAAEFRKKRERIRQSGRRICRTGRSRRRAHVENCAQHNDAIARGVNALDQPLPRAATGECAAAGFSGRRKREHAVYARVLPGKIAITDRVLQSAAQCRRREFAGCGASIEVGASAR